MQLGKRLLPISLSTATDCVNGTVWWTNNSDPVANLLCAQDNSAS